MTEHFKTWTTPHRRQMNDLRFYVDRIWRPACQEHVYIGSRRKWLDALTLLEDYEGRIRKPNGREYYLGDIYDYFQDPDMRWMTDFLAASECEDRPRALSPIYPRLELIYLYCEIRRYEAGASGLPV
ncbi:MAG: hypothetical protein AAF636_17790 [Pseudomonadota bacterium]